MDLELLLTILSEARVFILQTYNYCIKCRLAISPDDPCKHCTAVIEDEDS